MRHFLSRCTTLGLAVCTLTWLACDPPGGNPDPTDVGSNTNRDGGTGVDAGNGSPGDSGTVDAGAPIGDGGTVDAGNGSASDSGTTTDAGNGSPGDGGTADGGGDPVVSPEACHQQLVTQQEALRAEGVDVAAWSFHDAPQMADPGLTERQSPTTYRQYDGRYRPLSNHPGCSVDNLYYDKTNTATGPGRTPYIDGNNDGKWTGHSFYGGPNTATGFIDGDRARLPGYPCAAKEYAQPSEDTSKPIVILVHGNSSRPHYWEKFLLPPGTTINASGEKVQFNPDTTARDQLAERLIAAHYRVLAVDFRTDLVATVDPAGNNAAENLAGNVDHGWATPLLQSLLQAVMKNNPSRKVALVGHGVGATVARDALRRLYVEHTEGVAEAINPFPRLSHVILGSGHHHGISTYDPSLGSLCGTNPTMRGTVVCESGSRANYVQTYFHKPLNGPRELFATPCADGDYAFGKTGQCGGNVVKYFTLTMSDIVPGSNYQDLYSSEATARLGVKGCAVNALVTLNDYDTSGYFNKGFIANHLGSVRSEAGLARILEFLSR